LDGDIKLVVSFLGLALSLKNIAWRVGTRRGKLLQFDRAEFGLAFLPLLEKNIQVIK